MVEVFDKQDANYVVILSNAFNKRLLKKVYYKLDRDEGMAKMIRDVSEKYPDYFTPITRIDFARVVGMAAVTEG